MTKLFVLLVVLMFITVAEGATKRSSRKHPVRSSSGQSVSVKFSLSRFVEEAKIHALEIEKAYGIPVSATVAMACYESNYGRSYLARNGFNFFGIKAASWNGATIENPTDGISYRRYASMREGFRGYAEFLSKRRYQQAFAYRNNPQRFIKTILRCGYCPDDWYLSDIRRIMERHAL